MAQDRACSSHLGSRTEPCWLKTACWLLAQDKALLALAQDDGERTLAQTCCHPLEKYFCTRLMSPILSLYLYISIYIYIYLCLSLPLSSPSSAFLSASLSLTPIHSVCVGLSSFWLLPSLPKPQSHGSIPCLLGMLSGWSSPFLCLLECCCWL